LAKEFACRQPFDRCFAKPIAPILALGIFKRIQYFDFGLVEHNIRPGHANYPYREPLIIVGYYHFIVCRARLHDQIQPNHLRVLARLPENWPGRDCRLF